MSISSGAARRALMAVATGALGLFGLSCAGSRGTPPVFEAAPDPATFLAALEGEPSGDRYTASLFLRFEGGFLGEDRLKINGEIAESWPEGKTRVIGAYGAFRKVFDLLVAGARFELLDHDSRTLHRGGAFDPAAQEALGFAVRPGDIPRLMRLGGTGPLADAEIGRIDAASDSLTVTFSVPDDPGVWTAGYDPAKLRLTSLVRRGRDGESVAARYDRYRRIAGRWVPGRVDLRRLGGDERVTLEVRSIRFRDEIDARVFEPIEPADAEIVEL